MKKFLKTHLIFLIFISVYYVFAFLTYKSYGTSIDEWDVYTRGQKLAQRFYDDVLVVFDRKSIIYSEIPSIVNIYPNLFPVIQSSTEKYVDIYNYTYSNIYPALLFFINPSKNYEINHLINMFFGSFFFVISYIVLYKQYQKPALAFIGPLFMLFTPRLFGDIPANPKDIPFALLYFASLVGIIFTVKKNSTIRISILGILFGLTVSLHLVGLSLFIIYFLFRLFNKSREKFTEVFVEVGLIFCVSFLVQLLTIPFLGLSPIQHYFYLLKIESNFPWDLSTLSFGQPIRPDSLPWYYIPGWFLVTTPFFVVGLFLAGLYISVKHFREVNLMSRILLLSLGVNFLVLVSSSPKLYDGVRHLTFLVPQIITIAAVGFIILLKEKGVRTFIIGATAINILVVLLSYISLFPYHVLYFNELVGGLKGAHGKFEVDYWAFSYKEAILWLAKNTKGEIKIYTCGHHMQPYFKENMTSAHSFSEANYAICWERYGQYLSIPGEIIHTIKRQDVPLSHIYKIEHN